MLALFVDKRPSFHPDGVAGLLKMKPGAAVLGHPWKNPKKVSPLYFDASIREEHGVTVSLSREPIEDGSRITDHAVVEPDALTMEVIVSENKDRVGLPIATSFTPSQPAIKSWQDLLATLEQKTPIGVWHTLVALAKGRRPFDVVTSLAVYTNMMIVRLSTPRTAETTHALMISVALEKVQLVTVDQAANMTEEASNIGLSEQDMGAQSVADSPYRQYATGLI